MNKKFLMICLFFIFLCIIPFYCQFSSAKYVFDTSFDAVKIQIEKKPIIEILSVSNTNTGYEKYANQTHTITAQIKVTEEHIIINNMSLENLIVQVNGQDAEFQNIEPLNLNFFYFILIHFVLKN